MAPVPWAASVMAETGCSPPAWHVRLPWSGRGSQPDGHAPPAGGLALSGAQGSGARERAASSGNHPSDCAQSELAKGPGRRDLGTGGARSSVGGESKALRPDGDYQHDPSTLPQVVKGSLPLSFGLQDING